MYNHEEQEKSGYDPIFQPGMTLCIESYIGAVGGREGVKLEQRVLIYDEGREDLISYPFELSWL